MQTLEEALSQVYDPRHAHGKRYPLAVFILLILLGTMSGYRGYRGLERFMERHRETLSAQFHLSRQELPDYSTIRRLLQQIDFQQVAQVLSAWMQQTGWLQTGNDCAIDGKSLANTLSHHKDAYQNFVSVVSIFQLGQGLVVGQQVFANAETSEIVVVRQLIRQLHLSGMVFSLDALHLQKKRCN